MKHLMRSKWTRNPALGRYRHFELVAVETHGKQIDRCKLEAVLDRSEFWVNLQELNQTERWRRGWH